MYLIWYGIIEDMKHFHQEKFLKNINFKHFVHSCFSERKEDEHFLHTFRQGHLLLMRECRYLVLLSLLSVRSRVHPLFWGNSDKCGSCLEVNGGIELWPGPGCQERYEANFQQQGYNGMCVPICESFLCLCERTHRGPCSTWHSGLGAINLS